jgi:EmrB/QacA subfamily drug resistance transporter
MLKVPLGMTQKETSAVNRWLIFAVTGAGIFLATSALTVVNVALPFVTEAFQTDISSTQWVLLVYLLTTSSLLINFGRLGDLLSPFRVHYLGLIIFTLFSLLCSFAQSVEFLVTLRVFQGIGGAMIVSTSPGTVTAVFPTHQRGRILGLQAGLVGIALSIGPTLAGILIGFFGWRSIFLYNVPFGIIGILLCWVVSPPPQERRRVQIDIVGGVILLLTVTSFVLAINWARQIGWSSPSVLLVSAIFLLSLPGFLLTETLVPHPMLDLSLFRNRIFVLAQSGNFLIHVSSVGIFLLIPFYLVKVLGLSAQATGLTMLPLSVMIIIMGPISGSLADRMGTKWLSVSGVLFACLGYYSLTSLDQSTSILGVILRLSVLGLGHAVYQSPNLSAAMGSVSTDRMGIAGGIHGTMRHLGSLTGIAIVGSYFTARRASLMESQPLLGSPENIATSSFLGALHEVFFLALLIAILTLLTCLLQKTPRTKDQ